ncbi:hypothetical protein QBC47DRAFT_156952 [Echria macrotheca]|uniref:Transmembrane protein n=1 Tax=Echria macrotheca TaxID=438768 RepID=A0AAJ0F814_9PEZI|nr:hypothetical protein QBC47DRAFT_156952 [Echria macrotheca]
MFSVKLLVAAAVAACSGVLVRPTQAVVLGARQDLSADLRGPALPLSALLPRPPPTVTVTTQLSVTVSVSTSSPRLPLTTDSASTTPLSTPLPPPPPGSSPPEDTTAGSGVQTGADTRVNDMPTLTGTSPTATDSSRDTGSRDSSSSGTGSNRTLVITLSTVLSVVGLLLILGTVFACRKYRKGRFPFARGVSPIDDDEIATWKVPRTEKTPLTGDGAAGGVGFGATAGMVAMVGAAAGRQSESERISHSKNPSTSSFRKPPSVIVYSNPHSQGSYRQSTENSPWSFVSHDSGHAVTPPYKMSFEKVLPPPPVQAKAPNARVGLTDESIPGDEPFVPSPKRQTSRLSKLPPGASSHRRHLRTRSSRSSTRSFGDYAYGPELDFAQRHSHDYVPRSYGHSRVYSSSSIPPRLSFSDESVFSGGLSPRPLLAGQEIGRAIG